MGSYCSFVGIKDFFQPFTITENLLLQAFCIPMCRDSYNIVACDVWATWARLQFGGALDVTLLFVISCECRGFCHMTESDLFLFLSLSTFEFIFLYWKEKETHIHFECYVYQICIVCVNESVFEMLNIHILTYCDTFHCKQTTRLSCVNGKGDRGNASDMPAVCNNRKSWFFKCPGFGQFGINWKLLNVNISWRTKTMLDVSFKFMYQLMQLLMLLSARHLLPLYRPLKRANELEYWQSQEGPRRALCKFAGQC